MKKIKFLGLFLFLTFFWGWVSYGSVITVLCYHNILPQTKYAFDISVENFEKQMRFLKEEGFISLTASELVEMIENKKIEPQKKYVVITFDDGNDGFYQYGVPILEKYGLKATFYIYPSIIFSRERGRHKSYMTWEQIKELAHRKNFELGSHSYYHPRMTKESEVWLKYNIEKSSKVLFEKTGIKPLTFAYPFGDYNERVVEAIKNSHYKAAFTIDGRNVRPTDSLFTLPRYMILRSFSMADFIALTTGEHSETVVKKYQDFSGYGKKKKMATEMKKNKKNKKDHKNENLS